VDDTSLWIRQGDAGRDDSASRQVVATETGEQGANRLTVAAPRFISDNGHRIPVWDGTGLDSWLVHQAFGMVHCRYAGRASLPGEAESGIATTTIGAFRLTGWTRSAADVRQLQAAPSRLGLRQPGSCIGPSVSQMPYVRAVERRNLSPTLSGRTQDVGAEMESAERDSACNRASFVG